MAGIQIFAAGRAGDGTGSHAGVLAWALKDMGAWTFTGKEEVYSNIYTRDSCHAVRSAVRRLRGFSQLGAQDSVLGGSAVRRLGGRRTSNSRDAATSAHTTPGFVGDSSPRTRQLTHARDEPENLVLRISG